MILNFSPEWLSGRPPLDIGYHLENMRSHARPIKLRRSLKSDRQLFLPGAFDVVQSTYHDELKVRRSVSNRERRWLARAF